MAVNAGADILGDFALQQMRGAGREFNDFQTTLHFAHRVCVDFVMFLVTADANSDVRSSTRRRNLFRIRARRSGAASAQASNAFDAISTAQSTSVLLASVDPPT